MLTEGVNKTKINISFLFVVEKENKRLSNEKESKITEKPATQE
jgi:hypothetical protein